jgi:hypothetical protein
LCVQENFVPLQQRSRQNFKELEEMTAKAAELQLEVRMFAESSLNVP